MPAYWQITKLRGEQSFAVWDLVPAFAVGSKTRADLSALLDEYTPRTMAVSVAALDLSSAVAAKKKTLDLIRLLAVKGAGKLNADLDEEDELAVALTERVFSIDPKTEAAALERGRAFLPIWQEYDLRIGVEGPFRSRGHLASVLETALRETYPAEAAAEQVAALKLSQARTRLKQHNRQVDGLLKSWYAAWKAEYEEGTPEGDVLRGQVEAEASQQRPTALEIATLLPGEAGSLAVRFVPGGGKHATVRLVQTQIVGVDEDFQTVRELSPEDVANGVTLTGFTAGQQVKVRTDVGNSRDPSELGGEQSIVLP